MASSLAQGQPSIELVVELGTTTWQSLQGAHWAHEKFESEPTLELEQQPTIRRNGDILSVFWT
jgi:hypothetical protein